MTFSNSPAGRGTSRLLTCVIGLFVVIWLSGAVVFHFEWQEIEATRPNLPPNAAGAAMPGSRPDDSRAERIPRHDLVASLYRSLQLFHFHDVEWPDESPHARVYVIRFAAAIFGLSLPLAILGWIFQGGIQPFWHRRGWHRGFVVIAGGPPEASHLAQNLAGNGHHVVQVVPPASHPPAQSRGILTLAGRWDEPNLWTTRVGLSRARAVVVMAGNAAENISVGVGLQHALPAGSDAHELPCRIELLDLHLKKGLVSLLPSGRTRGLRTSYFNRYEIMARLLVRAHPLPAVLAEESAQPQHYIIVGFEQFGQNMALKLVKMGQQVVRVQTPEGPVFRVCKPRVTIVDRRGTKATEAFLRSHPGFQATCDLRVIAADCSDRAFLELAFLDPTEAPARCSLIFGLENETVVVTTILMMLDICAQAEKNIDGIYFRSARRDGIGHLLRQRQAQLAKTIPIVTFASDDEIFTEDVILNLSLDLMAAKVHEAYLGAAKVCLDPHNPAPAASKTWADLSEDEREGNREPADHLWAKARTLGYELEIVPLTEAPGMEPAADDALVQDIETHIEELSSCEHYRWMAWRLILGWTYGPVRENTRKIHPNLVSYEALTEPDREKDRVIVRIIPELLRLGRLRAKKISMAEP